MLEAIMGQKVNPKGFRLGNLSAWQSRWFANSRRYRQLLLEDVQIRQLLYSRLKAMGLAAIEIDRSINKLKITLHVSRPGMVIGRGGSGLEELKKYLEKYLATVHSPTAKDSGRVKLELAIEPIKEPNLQAKLVANMIVEQLEKRLPYKRVGNQAIERVMNAGARGARVILAGRIAGAEIARREKFQAGTVPLSTIREDVDFAAVPALTKSGYIGVKVWICRKT